MPPSSASPIFEEVAQLTAIMENYPTIESIPLSFTVTILKVTVPVISDLIYQVGSPLLTINFNDFTVLPELSPPLESSISVFLIDSLGSLNETYIDLSSANLTSIYSLNWIA